MAILIALALLAAACSDSADSTDEDSDAETTTTTAGEEESDEESMEDPAEEAAAPAGEETIEWEDCDGLECALVSVPADYEDSSLGEIDIYVAVHRARSPEDRVGYLFVNPGGPGEGGTKLVEGAAQVFSPRILDQFDIVGFDPRGVGKSEPAFSCGEEGEQLALLTEIDGPADTEDELQNGIDAVNTCIDDMGLVALRIHSEYVAHDMDLIREALGAEQISYLGFSYGSVLGGWYASIFPDRVRSMAVDGAANPLLRENTLEAALESLESSLGPLHANFVLALNSCADEGCPIWNDGDPTGYWNEVAPKMQLVADARDGDQSAIIGSIVSFLYTEDTWSGLHTSIQMLGEQDDVSGFLTQADARGIESGPSLTAHINCLDSWALFPEDTTEARIQREIDFEEALRAGLAEVVPLWSDVPLIGQASSCTFVGAAAAPPDFDGQLNGGGVDILVVGNTSDPVTNYSQSEEYANEVLNNGHLVQVDHPSHVAYPNNQCVVALVEAALIDLQYPDDEPKCEREEPKGALQPIEDHIEVVLEDGSTTVRPANWVEVNPGTYAQSQEDGDINGLFIRQTDDPVAAIAELFKADAEPSDPAEIAGRTWIPYSLALDGPLVTGLYSEELGVVIFALTSSNDLQATVAGVIIPAVTAYTPAG